MSRTKRQRGIKMEKNLNLLLARNDKEFRIKAQYIVWKSDVSRCERAASNGSKYRVILGTKERRDTRGKGRQALSEIKELAGRRMKKGKIEGHLRR